MIVATKIVAFDGCHMKYSLVPIEPPYSEHIDSALKHYPKKDGYLLKLFRVFANSKRFLMGKGVIDFLDEQSPITLRERELIILRVCANKQCEYEWGVHVSVFSKDAQLTRNQISSTCDAKFETRHWSDTEVLLLRVVDELCHNGWMSEMVSQSFQSMWTAEQQLEILALCGNYHTVSFVANASRLTPEPFAAKFSDFSNTQ